MTDGPLRGVRVLEFSLILSGPFCGMQLADMGADVIKVEDLSGDSTRSQGGLVPGASKFFQVLNRGRRALTVDLTTPEGREVIYRLMPSVDVVVVNYRPGVAKRLGVDYETLAAYRPDLIYAEITGFGNKGPMANLAASELTSQAYGGMIALTEALEEDGAPRAMNPFVGADEPSGMALAMGIVAALFHRQRTGEGQLVRTSLLRTVMMMTCYYNNTDPVQDPSTRDLLAAALKRARAEGGSYDDLMRARKGVRRPANIWFRPYRAKDGGIALGALTPANRMAMRKVLELEGQDQDEPGYRMTDPASADLMDARAEEVRQRLLTRTVAEWLELFNAAGAPVAPVLFPEELVDDPQASLHYVEIEHPLCGTTKQVGPLLDMQRTPTAVQGPAPLLGQHTAEIMVSAGYSAAEIQGLSERGVVFTGG